MTRYGVAYMAGVTMPAIAMAAVALVTSHMAGAVAPAGGGAGVGQLINGNQLVPAAELLKSPAMRKLLQGVVMTPGQAAVNYAVEVEALKRVKAGDNTVKIRYLTMLYLTLGCGGPTSTGTAKDVMAVLAQETALQPAFAAAGVAELRLQLAEEAMNMADINPPSKAQCDMYHNALKAGLKEAQAMADEGQTGQDAAKGIVDAIDDQGSTGSDADIYHDYAGYYDATDATKVEQKQSVSPSLV